MLFDICAVTDDITRAAANADSLIGGFLMTQASGSDRFASVRNEHRGNAEVLSRIATMNEESKRNLSWAQEKKSNEEVRRERHERMRGQALRNYYEQTRDAAARIITLFVAKTSTTIDVMGGGLLVCLIWLFLLAAGNE